VIERLHAAHTPAIAVAEHVTEVVFARDSALLSVSASSVNLVSIIVWATIGRRFDLIWLCG
jgi:hypothetical protein